MHRLLYVYMVQIEKRLGAGMGVLNENYPPFRLYVWTANWVSEAPYSACQTAEWVLLFETGDGPAVPAVTSR